MTGAPAETWRKFEFRTAPGWAYALIPLICVGIGLLLIFIVMYAVSRTATGHLPLSRAAESKLRTANSIGVGLFLLVVVLWAAGIALLSIAGSDNATVNTIGGLLLVSGLAVGLAAVAYWLLVKPRYGPTGKVMARTPTHNDNLVELRNVHPAFVAAVQQHQQAWVAQLPQSANPK